MKVFILAAGTPKDTDLSDGYPLLLQEFKGKPLIELLINEVHTVGHVDIHLFINSLDANQHQIKKIVTLIDPDVKVVTVGEHTQGAACTALLGIDFFEEKTEELLIINADELLDINFQDVVSSMRASTWDAGVLIFPSVHPRYSYVQISANGTVIRAAEKQVISSHATAGFYWFRNQDFFVSAAKEMIANEDHTNGIYYVCPTLNYLLLSNKEVGSIPISGELFHPLKSSPQITSFLNDGSK